MSKLLSRYDRFIEVTAIVAIVGGLMAAVLTPIQVGVIPWVEILADPTLEWGPKLFGVFTYVSVTTFVVANTTFAVITAIGASIALIRRLPRLYRPVSHN